MARYRIPALFISHNQSETTTPSLLLRRPSPTTCRRRRPLGRTFYKSLNITYSSYTRSPQNIKINALDTVILSLPNLERLVLKYDPGSQILNGADCPPKLIFDLPPASTLPPLRVLCLANFGLSPEQAAVWARFLA